jgi:membrane dipeptidase
MIFVDSHEDIAMASLMFGRIYTSSVAQTREAELTTDVPRRNGTALLGWPDWIQGEVAVVIATLTGIPARHRFDDEDSMAYSSIAEAHSVFRRSLEFYERLTADNPDKFRIIKTSGALRAHVAEWQADETRRRVGLIIATEGADGIQQPEELDWWWASGVRIVGPAWAGTQYCGGSGEPGPFTPVGRELLVRMAEVGIALDVSHLSEEATSEALATFAGPVMASHSNARALLPGDDNFDRHLSDDHIRRIIERDGVIGVVPYNGFLVPNWKPYAGYPGAVGLRGVSDGITYRAAPTIGRDRVTLAHLIAQVSHVCEIAGDTLHVGIGTDFDGGFGAESAPLELDGIGDVQKIGLALADSGYDSEQVAGILGQNWLRFLDTALPS